MNRRVLRIALWLVLLAFLIWRTGMSIHDYLGSLGVIVAGALIFIPLFHFLGWM